MRIKRITLSLALLLATSAHAITTQVNITNFSDVNCHVSLYNYGWLWTQDLEADIAPGGYWNRDLRSNYLANLDVSGELRCGLSDILEFDITGTRKSNRYHRDDHLTLIDIDTDLNTCGEKSCFNIHIRNKASDETNDKN